MGCGCDQPIRGLESSRSAKLRRLLWTVLVINAVLFVGEFATAIWADSTALLADSADNLGDMLTYAISLAVVGGTLHQRARAAQVKGIIQLLFGVAILLEVARKLAMGFDPLPMIIVAAAAVALVGNLACLLLLTAERNHDINMKSVWLCSRNDVIGNVAVISTALIVAATGLIWLDLIVGAALAALFLQTGVSVVGQARREMATA
jgi:Co/Zn/Cd efflux system component